MMAMSHLKSEASRFPANIAPGQPDTLAHEEPTAAPGAISPLPCWAAQALCDLERAERELLRLRERQSSEVENVNRGLERAILGARREERRLLERVEQDHRDAQRRLEQLQRENAAAARVGQSLVDQRLRQLAELRGQVQGWSGGSSALDQDRLLERAAGLLQPWEIALSLKRVVFRPSSQPKPVTFGEIQVQEHSLSLPVGTCRVLGQQCAHHVEMGQDHGRRGEQQNESDQPGAGQGPTVTSVMGGGSLRTVRKIRLSSHTEEKSGEEVKSSPVRLRRWPPRRDSSDKESSQEEDLESLILDKQGKDTFQAVPACLSNGESEEEEERVDGKNGARGRFSLSGSRKERNQALRSHSKEDGPDCGSRSWKSDPYNVGDRDEVQQCSVRGTSQVSYVTLASPRTIHRDLLYSHSCLKFSSRGHLCSCLSPSSGDHPLGTPSDRCEAPSPTDSLESNYTFPADPPGDGGSRLSRDPRLSRSTTDLSERSLPQIRGSTRGIHRASRVGRNLSVFSSSHGEQSQPCGMQDSGGPGQVCRSLSMSIIEGPQSKTSNQDGRVLQMERGSEELGERPGSVLIEVEEGDPQPTEAGHLVRQFGKQGSGRADFTLPSGIHATPQGQLFVVDCGNARVQVTDARGNILQQVTSPGPEGASRRCRNYFDIAVNGKGQIALSCAAERALLIFNRHGRRLQTFGGQGMGAKDELEAPRGVTVTHRDQFLVADTRRGTLSALKLDPKTGSLLERTVIQGFSRPYLVAACLSTGMVAVSERGGELGRLPCVRVLEPGWSTVRILGACSGMGPLLSCPWGICIDREGNILVADWGKEHRVVMYSACGIGHPIVTRGLSSPRGLGLLPNGHLVVSDSMHHCIKIFQYK